jgi:hypothetical protein
MGFVVDTVALGQVFSEYFAFPCQSVIQSELSIFRGWYIRARNALSGTGTGFLQVLRFPLSSGAGVTDQYVTSVMADLLPFHLKEDQKIAATRYHRIKTYGELEA